MARIAFLAFLAVTASRNLAMAQNLPPFGGGSLMLSWQNSGKDCGSPHCALTGVSGTAIGVTGEVGGFVSPAVSVAFEVSFPRRFDSIQVIPDVLSRSVQIENRHRDVIFSGVVRFHVLQNGRLRPAFVAGPSFVREDTVQRTAEQFGGFCCSRTGPFGPYGPKSHVTRWTPGIAYGVDLAVGVGRDVSIVPDVRMYWISRAAHTGSLSGHLALGSFIVRSAVGLRASF
jgi:hypothetical protein